MGRDEIGGLVRHILTFGGGVLVARDVISISELETGVGAIAALFGVVWSVVQKRRAA